MTKPNHLFLLIKTLTIFLIMPVSMAAQILDFDPRIDGYRFANYGSTNDNSTDLTKTDMIQLFGADQVCMGGQAMDCQLTMPAQRWMQDALAINHAGHCEGMAATSALMWLSRPATFGYLAPYAIKGISRPGNLQANTISPSQLVFQNRLLVNYIAFYNAMQSLREIRDHRYQTMRSRLLTSVIDELAASFRVKTNFYLISIAKGFNGDSPIAGHTLVPFGFETNNGIYRFRVYDSNYPGQVKFLFFNTANNGWSYVPEDNNPNAHRWEGNPFTQSFAITRMADRGLRRYQAPFGFFVPPGGRNEFYVGFNAPANIMVADPGGKKAGYDPGKRKLVNEIKDAQIEPSYQGDDDNPNALKLFLPYNAGDGKPYELFLSGTEAKATGNLTVTAPGFVAGFDKVSLDPGENLKMTITPDGKTVEYTASADGETPMLFITVSDGADKPSYRFEVGIRELRPGVKLTMKADIKNGKLYFQDDNGEEDIYELKMERIMSDGTRDNFATGNLDMVGPDSFEVDIKNWDNETDPCVKDDDNGNGFADEPCGDEDN